MIKRVVALLVLAVVLQYFATANKAVVAKPAIVAKVTYEGHVKNLIITKCAPCHLDSGDEVSYDNYESAKENINDIIRRIKLNPEQHGFMPQKAPKLSDSLIQIFEQWKADSLLLK